jgi:hypothetical protein
MDLAELRDYRKWVAKTAAYILDEVIKAGGWVNVFPEKLPTWASRVRNYFNITPQSLMKFDKKTAAAHVQTHHTNRGGLARWALSGDVYKDEKGRLWFEMSTGGTAYHYEGEVTAWKKFKGAIKPQMFTPVFKLISPDGSGGSREIIIDNPETGLIGRSSSIGEENVWVNIRSRVVVTEEYIGTYNYSETIVMGFPAHDLRDVQPHQTTAGFYLDPGLYTTLEEREFPATDPSGKVLADQN